MALDALRRLVSSGRVVEGELLPTENGGGIHGLDYCDAEVLRLLRRRSLAALRAEVEPVPAVELARFLPQWQSVGGGLRGREGLVRAIEQLAGAVLPASALESLVLPSRVVDYSPALLDDLTSSGEVLWRGHGSLPGDDGWVSLHLADTAHLTLAPLTDRAPSETEQAVVDALAGGGAYFFRTLADAVGSTDDEQLLADLWALTWDGRVSNDTLTPLRALLSGGRTTHKRGHSGPRTTRYAGRRGSLGALSGQRGLGRPAAADPDRPGGRRRALVAAPRGRGGRHRPRLRDGRGAARPLRRGHPWLGRGRGGARRVRRGLPRAGRCRGVRAGATRLLRRVARGLAVLHHRRRRPAPGRCPTGR